VSPIDRLKTLVRDVRGPLTRELLRTPGGFGLGQVPARLKPDSVTRMVCGFCSTGCSLDVHMKNGEAVSLSPSTDYSVNLGMACPKGWEALTPLRAPDRATAPLLRQDGVLRPVGWGTALEAFTQRFKAVQAAHGKESVAFLSTGQIVMEEMALLGAVAKFGMGIVHGDGNTRQCMATSAVAYKQSFGFDAPPFTYEDFEESDVMVFVGGNPCIAHPIMWERVCRNRHHPETIVVDPRFTETAQASTTHIPLKPKSDLTLFYAVAHILFRDDLVDQGFVDAHTSGIEEFRTHVQAFTPERASEVSGLSVALIEKLAHSIGHGKRVSLWWTMGVNQSYEGVRLAQALINIALLTGNIGRPGTGANSITGQCNAMGSRLFSNTTGLLGGHAFENPAHREKVAEALGIDVAHIPAQASYAYDQILDAVDRGEIRGLWIIATNTAHSWIHQGRAREVLKKLDFLVVQDMYMSTDTAELAHLVLPAAGWGEKDGTFINSERRIGLVKQVARAPGEALSDFRILRLIADAWGCGEMFAAWESPEAAFRILQRVSEGTPCDITGIAGYAMLDDMRGVQWPLPAGQKVPQRSQRRLFEDGNFYHPDGRAKFLFSEPSPLAEPCDADFPLTLLTGRGSSSQWHTETRTGKSAVLNKLSPRELYVELHPQDAATRNIVDGARVQVRSRRGGAVARAFVTTIVQPGQVFMPMHFVGTNRLTHASFDPHSRQPSYKASAVTVELL
jgi:anaerobic selenocysteine-containing dehydrogenase